MVWIKPTWFHSHDVTRVQHFRDSSCYVVSHLDGLMTNHPDKAHNIWRNSRKQGDDD